MMDEYQAPAHDAASDPDPAEARAPLYVTLAGGLLGVAGFFVAATGAQMIAFLYMAWWLDVLAWSLVLLGVATLLTAPFAMLGRAWASLFGSVLAAASLVAAWTWAGYTTFTPGFSLLAILTALVVSPTVLVVPLTIPASLRVTAARRALYR